MLVLGLVSFLAACGTNGGTTTTEGKPELKKFTVGVSSLNQAFLALYVGQKKGFFEEAGLDVEVVAVGGGTTGMAALASGSADIYAGLIDGAVSAASAGADVVVVSGLINQQDFKVIARPEINSLADLKGKKFGVVSAGNGTELNAKWLFDKVGVGSKNVTWVNAGATPDRLAALVAGQIDATIAATPTDLQAVDAGMKVIERMEDHLTDYSSVVMMATKKKLGEREAEIRAFLKAAIAASNFIYENKDGAFEVAKAVVDIKPELLTEGLRQYTEGRFYTKDGQLTVNTVTFTIDLLNTYTEQNVKLDPGSLLNLSYLPKP